MIQRKMSCFGVGKAVKACRTTRARRGCQWIRRRAAAAVGIVGLMLVRERPNPRSSRVGAHDHICICADRHAFADRTALVQAPATANPCTGAHATF